MRLYCEVKHASIAVIMRSNMEPQQALAVEM